MKYSTKKYYSALWKRYRSLVILYMFFITAWIYLAIRHTSIEFNQEFVTNWYINFTEDLLFFGTALLSLVLGSKLARDESFGTRVSALANGQYASKDAERFLKENVEDVMSYIRDYKLILTINEIDPDNEFIYIHVDSEYTAVNMCEDETVLLNLTGAVYPSPPVQGRIGQVTHHSVKREKLEPIYFIKLGEVKDLKNEPNNVYSKKTKVQIEANGSAVVKLCYQIWIPINADILDKKNNWFFHRYYHYAEDASYYIINNLNAIRVNFRFSYPERSYLNIDNSSVIEEIGTVLANGKQQEIILNKKFQKNDTFEMYFEKDN